MTDPVRYRRVFVVFLPTEGRTVRHLDEARRWTREVDVRPFLTSDDRPGLRSRAAVARLRERVGEFDPRQDAIAWIGGDPASLLLVGAQLADAGIRFVTYLRWERVRDATGRPTDETAFVPTYVNILPEL